MDVNVTEVHEAMQNEGWLIQRRGNEVLLVDSQEAQQAICSVGIELFNELEKSLIKRIGTITKAAGVYDVYIPVDVFDEVVDEKPGEDEEEQRGEEGKEEEKDQEEEPTGEEKAGVISRVKKFLDKE